MGDGGGDEPDKPKTSVFASAVLQFCFSSVGMMVGNKMAMDFLRKSERGVGLPSTLVVIQVVGTLFLLFFAREHIDKEKVTRRNIQSWLPVFTLFAGMLYTSAKTFQYVNVSFVIIVRNVGAIFTTFVEYFVRGTNVNAKIVAAELVIVCGTVIYGEAGISLIQDFWRGMVWCLINVLCQTLYGVTLKYKMDNDEGIKDMSKYTMSLFNNALCLPYLIIVAVASGEPAHYQEILPEVPVHGWLTIAATCFIGFMISTSGFGLQKLVSATTFLVINNMTKILNILLGVAILGDTLAGGSSVLGCFISLGGGFWYSWETMRLNDLRRQEAKRKADGSLQSGNPRTTTPQKRPDDLTSINIRKDPTLLR